MQIETIADSVGGRSLVAGANPPRRDKTALLRLRGENDLSTNLIIQPSLVE